MPIITKKLLLALTTASVTLSACSTTIANVTAVNSDEESLTASSSQITVKSTTLASGEVLLMPVSQVTDSSLSALDSYQLPDGVSLEDITIVEASLDGRIIEASNFSLGIDDTGCLAFFMNNSAFNSYFTGNGNVSKSIHNSETFANKTQEIRAQLLETYQTESTETEQSVALPDFLKAQVRGQSISRQQIATLKKGAEKLVKEGVFIDRNFYIVLEVANQTFTIQNTQANRLVSKFTIVGSDIENLLTVEKSDNEDLLTLPMIVEKVSDDDDDFFEPIESEEAFQEVLEIEEIEEILEFELGPELDPKARDFAEFNIPLDRKDLMKLEERRPDLKKRAYDEAIDQDGDLDDILLDARDREKELRDHYDKFMFKPVKDENVFDDKKPRYLPHRDFDLRPPRDRFKFPPPPPDLDGDGKPDLIPPPDLNGDGKHDEPLPPPPPDLDGDDVPDQLPPPDGQMSGNYLPPPLPGSKLPPPHPEEV